MSNMKELKITKKFDLERGKYYWSVYFNDKLLQCYFTESEALEFFEKTKVIITDGIPKEEVIKSEQL